MCKIFLEFISVDYLDMMDILENQVILNAHAYSYLLKIGIKQAGKHKLDQFDLGNIVTLSFKTEKVQSYQNKEKMDIRLGKMQDKRNIIHIPK